MSNHYDEGSLVVVSTQPPFQTQSGTPTDPTDVYFEWVVTAPNGVVSAQTIWHFQPPSTSVTGSITRTGPGAFSANMDTTNTPGLWQYRWRGTGALQAVFDGSFYVDPTPLT